MSLETSSKKKLDPYIELELERAATQAEIKRAYFQKVRQHPPEQNPEKFQTIRKAYEQLRDPKVRAKTDLFLLQPPPTLRKRRRPTYDLKVHQEDIFILATELVVTPMEQDFREIT